jgi:iron complex outermembrane recepter protein
VFAPLILGALLASPARAGEGETTQVVVSTTPLPGLGIAAEAVAGNVELYTAEDLAREHAATLGEFLERNATSLSINAAQGNSYQQDLEFRGFIASPNLGTPQGVSVFLDGVRINEPFGDVVNFDLIPEAAIASLELVPGSNPAYGLNTLGGALALTTKNGRDAPGASFEASAGNFGRERFAGEYGASAGPYDVYLAASHALDEGWALHNGSRLEQLFAKAGARGAGAELELSLTLADDHLQGTQTIPESFLADPREPYTYPDINDNRLAFLVANGSAHFGEHTILSANAYYRDYRNGNLSSNANTDPAAPVPATLVAGSIAQDSYGSAAQLSTESALAGHDLRFVLASGIDASHTRFDAYAAPAEFTADRNTLPLGSYAPTTSASSTTRAAFLGAEARVQLTNSLGLALDARYASADTRLLDDSGLEPALDGSHHAGHARYAASLAYTASPRLSAYGSLSQGMRVPTPIELACADPSAPCSLPNSFLADPRLEPILSQTLELGLRLALGTQTRLRAALYRTDLARDLAFVSASAGAFNSGYFQNVGDTRREGLELGLETAAGKLRIASSLALVQARFRSAYLEPSGANSSADAAGSIEVLPGDRIPDVPGVVGKLRLSYAPAEGLDIGLGAIADGPSYARGDEDNADRHGEIPGYLVLNLDGRWQLRPAVELYARIDNLLDRRYANFGILADNFFSGPGHGFAPVDPPAEQFRGLGLPRSVVIGFRCSTH